MKTAKKNELKKEKQIDRMIDEGLGAGLVIEEHDKKKLQSEAEKKKAKKEEQQEKLETTMNGTMVEDLDDLKRLGNEMEKMKTNKQIKKDGRQPDPKQQE